MNLKISRKLRQPDLFVKGCKVLKVNGKRQLNW